MDEIEEILSKYDINNKESLSFLCDYFSENELNDNNIIKKINEFRNNLLYKNKQEILIIEIKEFVNKKREKIGEYNNKLNKKIQSLKEKENFINQAIQERENRKKRKGKK